MSQQDLEAYRHHQQNRLALAGAARDQLALGRSHATDTLPKSTNPDTPSGTTSAGGER
ncbi:MULTISPECIES: hypothetical protein [unclassified Streptomyces]|uniref:hypothetical protein n=1 Tax=unclassified Streptomyces TaxID=2593676 RepID=UPI002365AE5C|nr:MULTISPECIES: hypothetical protein [unclassified Streptomyces]MDF3141501.1 hypothetical protein [Streptomyces sp. T21Q-yed]WDF45018.1 hypothetical protein PBV52_50865 [Streptomyces sp. T12]